MLSANGEPLTVVDDDGHVEGLFTLTLVEQLLSDDGGGPAGTTNEASRQPGAEPAPQGRRV
jgi:phage protein U